MLYCRFLHGRILLFRPIVAQLCLQRDKANDPGAMWVESFSRHTVIKGSSLCLEDSHQVIDLIYKYLDIDAVTGPLPSWWYCVLCAYFPTFSLFVLLTLISCLHGRNSPSGRTTAASHRRGHY